MAETWRIDIEDHNGDVVTVLKNFQYFSCELRVGRRESFRIQLADNDPNRNLIHEDYIARVWYKNSVFNIPWTNVFNGIIKTPSRVHYSNGRKLAIFYGSGPNELIDKSLVMYPTDSPQAGKNMNALTAMYEFIDENIGANALVSNGRFFDHVNPITIQTVGTCGLTWTGNASHAILVKTLQDIRDFSYENNDGIDFQTYYMGDYQWKVQIGKIYTDRRAIGVSKITGKNMFGNVPVVLGPLYNNVDNFVQTKSRIDEANAILALGRYQGNARDSITVMDSASLGVSPIAQREALVQAQNSLDINDLIKSAQAELRNRVGRTEVSIAPKFSPGFALFKDVNIGDFISVISFEGEITSKQLDELKITVQQTTGGSTISGYTLFLEDRGR